MVTEELTRLMHADAKRHGGALDLEQIHRLGRRRRWVRRAATGVTVCATVAVLGGARAVFGGGDGATVRAAAEDHQATSLTSYEKNVLADVPGSYQVDGTVVLPDVADPLAEDYRRLAPRRIIGTPQELGFHGSTGPGYLPSSHTEKAYQQNAPKGSQVVVDPGPLWVGCMIGDQGGTCEPTVLAKDSAGRFIFLHGFGTENFLKPGADMELFVDDDFADRTWSQSLIGGFHGATTTRVLIEMTDGSQAEAQLDVDSMSPGNTLFWAKLAKPVAWARAYDGDGKLLAEHRLRDCTDPVDCEVR